MHNQVPCCSCIGLLLAAFCSPCLHSYHPSPAAACIAFFADNPQVWTRCGHHFHMQCLYEWLERKETCPLCEAVIDFDGLS